MRRLLSLLIKAPKTIRTMWHIESPLRLKTTSVLMRTSSLQGDSLCNGTHSNSKALLSDPQLFEAQFDVLVTELSESDLADPALADALNRFREVCMSVFYRVTSDECTVISCCSYMRLFPLSGFGVQFPRRQEEPRTVRDRFTEGSSLSHSARTGHSAAGSVGWLVH